MGISFSKRFDNSQDELFKMYQEICNVGREKKLSKEIIDDIITKIQRDHSHYSLKQTYEKVLKQINKMSSY